MAEALYRKYRPQVFEDVVGQEPIERTLKNAIEQDKVSHAYLFCGPRGTGKTTTARLLAKALLCEKGPTPNPDGTCEDCQLIADGVHPDVYELDAASRTGVDNVREEIISRVQFAPTRGRSKVYIIDEVHMLSTAAFNALLKTLEEPPSHVVFILCTTDPQKVPETIHSRCQRFDFRRISPEGMVARLGAICIAEDVEFEGEALDLIAQRAEGGLRNALTSLEQIIAFENGKVTLAGAERLLGSIDSNDMAEIMAYIGKRDIANCFRWTAAYVETGSDLAQFVRDMSEHVRNLYILTIAGDDVELDVSETSRYELAGELQWFGSDRAARLLGVLGDLSAELKTASNPRLAFEIALTRMVRPDSDLTLESLAERIEALEGGYSSVAHVLPGRPVEQKPVGQEAVVDDAGRLGANADGDVVADDGLRSREGRLRPEIAAEADAARVADNAPVVTQTTISTRHVVEVGEGAEVVEAAAREASATQLSAGETAPVTLPPQSDAQMFREGAASGEPPADAGGMALGVSGRSSAASSAAAASSSASKLAALANPAGLQRVWQSVLSSVKKDKQAYGVLFLNTKASYDADSGMVNVLFPEDSTFAFSAVQKPEVQDTLANAFVKAVGEEVPFCYVQASGTRVQGNARPSERMGNSGPDVLRLETEGSSQVEAPETPRSARNDGHGRFAHQPPAGVAPVGEVSDAPDGTMRPAVGSIGAREATVQPGAVQKDARQSGGDAVFPGASAQSAAPARAAAVRAPYEEVPYEQVPYDEMPYDFVPYDEFDAPFTSTGLPAGPSQAAPSQAGPSQAVSLQPVPPQDMSSQAVSVQQAPQRQSAALGMEAGADARDAGARDADAGDALTGASPTDHMTPTGSVAEDPADLQALLRAGFGDGVVISEVSE